MPTETYKSWFKNLVEEILNEQAKTRAEAESKITDLDYIHHFFIECDDNFTFDIEIEKGQVFAIKERTLIENDSLYYSGNIKDIKDFVIIETLDGDVSKYNTYIEINNSNIKNSDIKSIMIKKIR